jgi:hypothetical protein
MPVFGTTNFGSGSGGPSITLADTFVSASDEVEWTFSGVDFGTGGQLVIGFGAGYRTSQTISSWSAAGTAITTRTQATNSENLIGIGTVDVGSNTSGTLVINVGAQLHRIGGFVWDVNNVDLSTVSSNPTANKSFSLTFGTIAANGIAVAIGYDQDAGITGASGLDYAGEVTTGAGEGHGTGGAHRLFTAAQSSYSFNFTGSAHHDGSGSAGLALPPAS